MNHVNAIRCNDEYQCSHCGKSWDIHEEAPDCKMTLVEMGLYKTVMYFGLSVTIQLLLLMLMLMVKFTRGKTTHTLAVARGMILIFRLFIYVK